MCLVWSWHVTDGQRVLEHFRIWLYREWHLERMALVTRVHKCWDEAAFHFSFGFDGCDETPWSSKEFVYWALPVPTNLISYVAGLERDRHEKIARGCDGVTWSNNIILQPYFEPHIVWQVTGAFGGTTNHLTKWWNVSVKNCQWFRHPVNHLGYTPLKTNMSPKKGLFQ